MLDVVVIALVIVSVLCFIIESSIDKKNENDIKPMVLVTEHHIELDSTEMEHRKITSMITSSYVTLLKTKIIMISKLQLDGCQNELVWLMIELNSYEDTSDFLDNNPQIHEAIFHIRI